MNVRTWLGSRERWRTTLREFGILRVTVVVLALIIEGLAYLLRRVSGALSRWAQTDYS